MSLTIDQSITLYEILQVPYSDTVTMPIDEFFMTSIEYVTSNETQKMQTRITDRINNLGVTGTSRLVTWLDQWDALSTNTVSISGSMGGINGVEFDPDVQLERIASRVKVLVPVMQYHREITNSAITNPLSISSIR